MRKYNLFFKWLFSYIWVLAFPLSFGILLHIVSLTTIREEANRLLDQDIERDMVTMEGILRSSYDVCSTLLNIPSVTSFHADPSDPGYALKEQEIQNTLSHLKAANSTIHSIYIYYPKAGFFLGDSITLRTQDSNPLFRFRFALDRDVLLEYLSHGCQSQFYIIENPVETNASLLYISSFSSLSGLAGLSSLHSLSGQNAIVLLLLKDSRIQQQLATEGISILLKDSIGHTLTLKEDLTPEVTELLKIRQTPLQTKSYRIQSRQGATYQIYAIMKNDNYMKKLQTSRRLLLFYVIFCTLAGGMIAWFLAKKQYSPIQELLEITSHSSGEASSLPATEYDTIRDSIQHILQQYEENQERLKQQNIQLQSNSLAALLRSRHSSPQTDLGYYRQFSDSFSYEEYLLLSFDIADLTDTAERIEGTDTEDVLYVLLCSVMQKFLPEETQMVSTRIDTCFYFLLEALRDNRKIDTFTTEHSETDMTNGTRFEPVTEKTAQSLRQIILFLQETYQMMVWGNISKVHSGQEGILTAYQELCMLTDYRNRIGSDQIVLSYEQIASQPDILSQLQLWEQEKLAIWYMEHQQYEQVYPLLAILSQNPELSASESTQRDLQKALQQTFPVVSPDTPASEEEISPASEQASDLEATSALDLHMQKVAEYINQHYTEPQLSVAAIAEQFHFSVSYLSRKFKEKRGIGILAYINQRRLQKAKELLADGLSVTDTASAVGFYTTRPLLRLFHDEEGMTPVEYQKQQKVTSFSR